MSNDDTGHKLLRSRFDTRRLPEPVAQAIWHDSINVLFDVRSRKTVEDGFYASVDAALIGDVALGRLMGTGQEFDRSRSKIARDGMDGYVLQFYLKGQSAARSDARIQTASEGDLYILDMAQPLATTTSDHDQFSLIVPRRLLAPRLNSPDGVHMKVAPGTLPLVGLFRDSLASFYKHLDNMTVSEAEAVMSPLLDMAVAAINGHVTEDEVAAYQVGQFSRIRHYVEEHLLDQSLSLDSVMGAFQISRRTAYRLFEAVGGFSTFVNRRRLKRSLDALRASRNQHISIAAIGAMHGFDNAENFSRAFRREFGLSPRTVRQFAGASINSRSGGTATPETEWSHWISDLGR